MPGYEFKSSGINVEGVDTFYEQELYYRAQHLIEDLAVATGNAGPEVFGSGINGKFAIVLALGVDDRGVIGLQPAAPINVNATKQTDAEGGGFVGGGHPGSEPGEVGAEESTDSNP